MDKQRKRSLESAEKKHGPQSRQWEHWKYEKAGRHGLCENCCRAKEHSSSESGTIQGHKEGWTLYDERQTLKKSAFSVWPQKGDPRLLAYSGSQESVAAAEAVTGRESPSSSPVTRSRPCRGLLWGDYSRPSDPSAWWMWRFTWRQLKPGDSKLCSEPPATGWSTDETQGRKQQWEQRPGRWHRVPLGLMKQILQATDSAHTSGRVSATTSSRTECCPLAVETTVTVAAHKPSNTTRKGKAYLAWYNLIWFD